MEPISPKRENPNHERDESMRSTHNWPATETRERKAAVRFLPLALLALAACEGPPPTSPALEGAPLTPPTFAGPSPATPGALADVTTGCRFAVGTRDPFGRIPIVRADMGAYAGLDTAWASYGMHNWPILLDHVPLLSTGGGPSHLLGLEGPDCGTAIARPAAMPTGYTMEVRAGTDNSEGLSEYWFHFTTSQSMNEYWLDRPGSDIIELELVDFGGGRGEVLDEVHIIVGPGLARLYWGCWYKKDPTDDPEAPSECAGRHDFVLW